MKNIKRHYASDANGKSKEKCVFTDNMVGSNECVKCEHHKSINRDRMYVRCELYDQKEENMSYKKDKRDIRRHK